jgi:hypothetical protein
VAWGSNGSGQCDVPAPNAGFVAVAGGGYHSLGVKSDGTIVAWGYNGDGQCDVPAPNADFLAVSGGEWYSLGLRSDGSIVAWGANNYGQCDVPAPNTDFFMVAAGSYHSLGLKYDGTIVAWGENGDGQCDIPVPNADFIAVAGGALHSLGLKDASGTGVEEPEPGDVAGGPMLAVLSLSPNPFNLSTEVSFESREPGLVTMEIYDVSGRCVRMVPIGHVERGLHHARWDGRDASGADVASGVYFVHLRGSDGECQRAKAVLLR